MQITPIGEAPAMPAITASTQQASAKQLIDKAIAERNGGTAPAEGSAPGGQAAEFSGMPAPSEAAKPDTDRARFEALSRKEKAILQERRRVQQMQKDLESRYAPYEKAASAAQKSKLEAIKELGITYDDLTNEQLQQIAPSPEQIAARIAEEKLQEFEKRQQETFLAQQQQAYNQAIKQIKIEAKSVVDSSEAFPLVKQLNAFDTVSSLIELEFNETGRIKPVEEAIKEVESFYREELRALYKPSSESESVAPNAQKPLPTQRVQQPSQTLTHRTSVAPSGTRQMTAEERRQRAIDIFYGRS